MSFYNLIQGEVMNNWYRALALSHLFRNYDLSGTDKDHHDEMIGIGVILEDIAKRQKRIYALLDSTVRPDEDFEIKGAEAEPDDLCRLELAIKQGRTK